MARAIWSGVLTFGLVSVPVELYSATEAHGPVFHQFEKGTADRIRYQRVNERTTDEVEYSNIVKGAETGVRYRIAEPLVTFYQAIMSRKWARLELGDTPAGRPRSALRGLAP